MNPDAPARSAVPAVVCAALALYCGRRVAAAADALRLAHASPRPPLEARIAEAAAVRHAAADRRWMDLLLEVGDRTFYLDHGEGLAALAERVTDLDPGFVGVYAYASSMLMWSAGRPQAAVALLEKGIRMNPQSVKLRYYLAAFTFSRLRDLGTETKFLEALAHAPDAPFILRRILVNVYLKQGRRPEALAVLRLIWNGTRNGDERRWVALKMNKLGVATPESEP